jgi:hypothetical protein
MKTRTSATAGLLVALLFSPAIASADAVLDWNVIMVTIVSDQPPPFQNRFAAITHLAVFEAVNALTGDYKPYLGMITASRGASAEAAAVAAAHAVLRNYFPDSAAILDAARASSLAWIPDGPAKSSGIAVGETAAVRMIAARAKDGSGPPESYLPSSSNPGEWQLTSGCPATGGVFLHWRNVTPFVIRSAAQFRSDPPPAITSDRYTRAYKEVKEVGGLNSTERLQDRANVARFYAALGDAVLWNPIARQIAAAQGRSLAENARAFALLNMALSDVGVALIETKYHYNFWRPETAIWAGGTDENPRTDPDPSFVPFITTPCHPSYPSGHAATSYAAREVLERIFGSRGHSITLSSPAVPDVTLKYARLKDITDDIDDARVYGGIHFRFDQEAGAEQGRRLGAYVYKHSLGRAQSCTCSDEEREE